MLAELIVLYAMGREVGGVASRQGELHRNLHNLLHMHLQNIYRVLLLDRGISIYRFYSLLPKKGRTTTGAVVELLLGHLHNATIFDVLSSMVRINVFVAGGRSCWQVARIMESLAGD